MVTSVYDKSDLRPDRLLWRTTIEGVDVRVINLRLSNKHGFLVRVMTFAGYALAASWYALTLPADVIIASSGPITVGIPGLAARYLRGRRLVFEVRDLWPEVAVQLGVLRGRLAIRLSRWFERRCYGAAAVVVALSEGMAEAVKRVRPETPVVTIPNASNLAQFQRPPGAAAPDRHPALVVYTGTLGKMDDCGQIVSAAEALQRRGRRDIRIAVLGDGMERPALERRAADLGLTNLEFRGLVTKAEVVRWLHRASCAIVTFGPAPVLGTVSPNKVFDALAAGVPIVQTTQGWLRHLLEREACGLTVPHGAAAALADAIERIVDDPAARQAMSDRAARLAAEAFEVGDLATRFREALVGTPRGVETTTKPAGA